MRLMGERPRKRLPRFTNSGKPGPRGHSAWSLTEHRILKEHYPRIGAEGVKELLDDAGYDRTLQAIRNHAWTYDIRHGDIPGYVTVNELHPSNKGAASRYYRMLFEACKDGVLLELPTNRVKYLVPIEWVEKKQAEREARDESR